VSGVGFVSANDVLCSDFAVATLAGVLLIALNFRERFPDFTETDAGNYAGVLSFGTGDFADASLIRKILQSGPPHYSRSFGGALPGFWKTICSTRVSVVTSWIFPFFQEFEVEDCEHILHRVHMHPKILPLADLAVVHRPRRGEIAVQFCVRSLDRVGLQRELPLGAAVQMSI